MSSSGTLLFLGVVAGAGALFATKPSRADVNDLLREQIRGEIESGLASSDDPLAAIIGLACSGNSSDCVELIRQLYPVSYEDAVVVALVTLGEGTSGELNCVGLLNQLYCPGFLNQDGG